MRADTKRGKFGGTIPGVGYVRVSTQGQVTDGVSIDAQRGAIQKYCNSIDVGLLSVYSDAGVSGRRASNRPQLEKAIETVCDHQGVLVVYSLSRLARSLRDTIRIADRLEKSNAQLVLLAEQIDTQSAAGRMFFYILAALAQFESDIAGERTKAALIHKRDQGERWCNSAPYGFRWHRNTLRPDSSEQRIFKRMIRLRNSGLSFRTIASKLRSEGVRNRAGSAFPHQQIHRLLNR